MIVGFTGSRVASSAARDLVDEMVMMTPGDEFRSGACIGVDEAVARAVAVHFDPERVRNVVIVPADRSRVSPEFLDWCRRTPGVVLQYMPDGTTYRARNIEIVRGCDLLVGFPSFSETDSPRSGSWQTIRFARAQNIPTIVRMIGGLI